MSRATRPWQPRSPVVGTKRWTEHTRDRLTEYLVTCYRNKKRGYHGITAWGFYRWKKCADWYLLIHLFSLVRNKFYCQPWLSVCTYNLLETISAGWKSNNYLRSIHQSHKYKTNIFLSFFFLLSLAYVLQKPRLFLVVINVKDLCSDFATDFRSSVGLHSSWTSL